MTPGCLTWGSLVSEDTLDRGEGHGGGQQRAAERAQTGSQNVCLSADWPKPPQRPLCTPTTAVVSAVPLVSSWSQGVRTQTCRKPAAPLSPRIAPEMVFCLAPHTAPSTVCVFVSYSSCSGPEPSYVYAGNSQKMRFSGS